MRQKFGEYYLGVDIGTNSVGWAVTDEEYNILDFKNKAMWGIHLFDEGESAQARRFFRTARRRNQRRRKRILLLRELLKSEVDKTDPTFFERLDQSYLHVGDLGKTQRNSLFDDDEFDDKNFHEKFPTIHHLRYHLMTSNEKPDIRLVYLALHNILKYRGHFLFSGLGSGKLPDFDDIFSQLIEKVNVFDNIDIEHPAEIESLKEILSNRDMGVRDRGQNVMEILSAETKEEKAFSRFLAGSKVDLSTMFGEEFKDIKMSLSDGSFEDTFLENEDVFGGDLSEILELSQQVYNWSVLTLLLKGFDSISEAKIKDYNQHGEDLKQLKKIVKEFVPQEYNTIFRSNDIKDNYCAYSKNFGDKEPKVKFSSQEDFCKFIENKLKNKLPEGDAEIDEMMRRIVNGTFMPKQTSKDNSAIPYNIHHEELKTILEKASIHYPVFNEKGKSGLSIKDKILKLHEFRIPYYVGPVNPDAKTFWAERRSNDPITPWNFEDIIDLDKSSLNFIENLTNNCIHLPEETVLPKNSLLYSKYMLYNEINPLKINGERVSAELKNEIVRDLFITPDKTKNVTRKAILSYLVQRGLAEKGDEITGIDINVKANLRSFKALRNAIGDKVNDVDLAEDIILDITVFGDDRARLVKRLTDEHSDKLTESEINELSRLKFNDWGSFSQKLLTEITSKNSRTGEVKSIMDLLEETSMNFNEILFDKDFSFRDEINKESFDPASGGIQSIQYEDVDKLHLSPAVKRATWRAISVLKDVVKVIGHPPKKTFVETTRGKRDSGRTVSRKDSLSKLLKSCKSSEYADLDRLISGVDKLDESELRGRSLYLYYTQHSRCMYCSKTLDLNDLRNKNAVNRDHIYPRSKTVDDSLHNNLVLVCSTCNQNKGDSYPISSEVQDRMKGFWTFLRSNGFISKEKYSRLIRIEPLSDDELNSFIGRQIVETSQSASAVINLLNNAFDEDSEIIYTKGRPVSEFRNQFDFVKSRNVNDYHHAKDAYLNIVVGNVYDTKFTKRYSSSPIRPERYNLAKMYDWDVYRDNELAWKAGEDGTIATVRKYMNRNNILFTKYSHIEKGGFYNQNASKGKKSLHRLKEDLDPEKYGGYDSASTSYFVLVDGLLRKKKIRSLEPIPIYLSALDPSDEEIIDYIESETNLKDVSFIRKVKMKTLFEFNKFRGHLILKDSTSVSFHNGIQLIIPNDIYDYSKKIYNYIERSKTDKGLDPKYIGVNEYDNLKTFDVLFDKACNPPYETVFSSLVHNLKDSREDFISASLDIQARALNQIFNSFKCDASSSNLKILNKSSEAGRITKSKRIASWGADSVKIIDQSPSGLFESETEIMLK